MLQYDDPTLKELMSSPRTEDYNDAVEDLDDWFNGVDNDEDNY